MPVYLREYKDRLDSREARLKAQFSYPNDAGKSYEVDSRAFSFTIVALRESLIGRIESEKLSILILFIPLPVPVLPNFPNMPGKNETCLQFLILKEVKPDQCGGTPG